VPLVTRHVVATPTGPIHLRAVAGPASQRDEPPLLLLHQSPLSSRRFGPLLAELGRRTAAFAPDTPGYGESPALPGEATVTELAHALWTAVDGLTPGPVRLLGRATGAVLALQMAAERPARVEHLVLHGMPLYSSAEAADRLREFAPPYVLDADGGHLGWIWRRVSGEYPWADAVLRTELVADYLAAGPDFATAYRAVWRFDIDAALDTLQCKGIRTSLIAGGLDRIGFMHERVRQRLPRATERVLPDATDFVAEQDPTGFARVIWDLVGAREPITH
jgi:pimeloyl-ACP methyl ester carboxylesterase